MTGIGYYKDADSMVLMSCGADGELKLYTDSGFTSSTTIKDPNSDRPLNCLAVSPKGDSVAVGDGDNQVKVQHLLVRTRPELA